MPLQHSLFTASYTSRTPKFDKKQACVELTQYKTIRPIFERWHYKGGVIGGGISFCLALWYCGELAGGMVVGLPRHSKTYPGALDIRRMACLEEMPCNTESYFLSQACKYMKKHTNALRVITYADETEGHTGVIYKAANFKHVGTTAPTKWIEHNGRRYHPRSISIDRPYSYALRKAVKEGEAKWMTGLPKHIYVYELYKRKHATHA